MRYLAGQLRPTTVVVEGVEITVPPGVLDPALFRTGAWFATLVEARVATRVAAASSGFGTSTVRPRVLDLGCGTGVVGVLAQRAGAEVVAVDLDPRAVAAARANGLQDVRTSDLFGALGDERFDLVCFNPPFFAQEPGDGPLDHALFGGEDLRVVTRFAEQVARHLRADGEALVCWSSLAPPAQDVLGKTWQREASAEVGRPAEPETVEAWLRGG